MIQAFRYKVHLVSVLFVAVMVAIALPALNNQVSAQAADSTFELVSVSADGEALGVVLDGGVIFYRPAVSSGGEKVLFARDAFEPFLWTQSTGAAESFGNGHTLWSVLSANGQFAGREDGLVTTLVDIDAGTRQAWPDFEIAGMTEYLISPRGISNDGTVLLSEHRYNLRAPDETSRLVRHDLVSGVSTVIDEADGGVEASEVVTRLTADGRFVLVSDLTRNDDGEVYRYDAQNGSIEFAHTSASLGARSSQNMSQDGRWVAYRSSTGQVLVRDMNTPLSDAELITTNAEGLPAEDSAAFGQPMISDDGRFVLFNSDASDLDTAAEGRRFRMYLFDRQTSSLRTLIDGEATLDSLSFYGMAMAGDASAVFFSTTQSLSPVDTNDRGDLYRLDLTELPEATPTPAATATPTVTPPPVDVTPVPPTPTATPTVTPPPVDASVTPVPPTPTPEPRAGVVADDPGHSVSANDAGQKVVAAITTDARLRVRTYEPDSGWGPWEVRGTAMASADVAIDPAGDVHLIAVSQAGELTTSTRTAGGAWHAAISQGRPTWDVTTSPSIAANGLDVVIGAVKANGLMYTRRTSGDVVEAWVRHGLDDWAHVDVAMAANGTSWLVATKGDGRLYTRSWGAGWSAWSLRGVADWSADTPPAVAAAGSDATLLAIKADGRMYTLTFTTDSVGTWRRHGLADWESGDVTMSASGQIAIAGAKDDSRLFTRSFDGLLLMGRDSDGLSLDTDVADIDGAVVCTNVGLGHESRLLDAVEQAGARITLNTFETIGIADQNLRNGGCDVVAGTGLELIAARLRLEPADDEWVIFPRGLDLGGGSWGSWDRHGAPTWSSTVDPSVTMGGGGIEVLAVKNDSRLFSRPITNTPGDFVLHGEAAF